MTLRGHLEIDPHSGERRSSPRRRLQLVAEGVGASAAQTQVVIHDLSEEGLLIESPVPLAEGELLEVDIPEAGSVQAKVSWNSGRFFGCKFTSRISTAAVSAALLRSPAPGAAQPDNRAVEKALVELEALSFAIKRVTRAVDQAIDRLAKKKD
ncbi:MAG: PilZ domain-containing protein [Sphingomonas sp.]|nr:PilZ domain-containing protein [Sphingomonas sp.]